MKSRLLFIVTAAVEFITGLALISFPTITVEVLLGSPLSSVSGTIVGRIAGTALIAIALACWMSRNDKGSLSAKALVSGLLLYNFMVAGLLVYAGIILPLSIMLVLVIIVHLGLTAWCLFVLQYVRRTRR